MTRDDVPSGTGQCDIRLRVDGEAEVSLRGDTLYIHTITGRDGRDDGSECNQPLPARGVQDFRFEVIDRRDDIRLLSEPSGRNGAVVAIRDSQGGEGRYHFRFKWALTGSGGWRGSDSGNWRGRDTGDRQGRDAGNVGPAFGSGRNMSRWDQTVNYSGRGRGRFFRPGEGQRGISAVVVRIERNGRVLTDLSTDRGRVSLAGQIVRVLDNGRIAAAMRSTDGRVSGEMLLIMNGQRVREIRMDTGSGRDRIQLEWSEN
jgi:hypothetical protein